MSCLFKASIEKHLTFSLLVVLFLLLTVMSEEVEVKKCNQELLHL